MNTNVLEENAASIFRVEVKKGRKESGQDVQENWSIRTMGGEGEMEW